MTILLGYLKSFSVTHLFFAVFLSFGLGIFSSYSDEQQFSFNLNFIYLCIIATMVQALVFTAISHFTEINGIRFFVTALMVELVVANVLFFYQRESMAYADGLKNSLLMNVSIVAALFITSLIKEYQAQEL